MTESGNFSRGFAKSIAWDICDFCRVKTRTKQKRALSFCTNLFRNGYSQWFFFANFDSGVLISVERKNLHCCRRRGDVEKNNEELFCFGLTGVWLCWEVLLLQRRMQIRADCTKRAVHSKVLTQEWCIIDEHKPCTKQLRTCSHWGCPCIERNFGEASLLPQFAFM